MNKIKLERNIMIYYVFQLLREPLLWGPILITFIQRTAGMSLPAIYAMEAAAVVGVFLLEIPTGAMADLLGRRKTIFIGSILIVLEGILFTSTVNPLMAWLADFVWVAGYSLMSGADSSMLEDTLLALGREKEFKRIQGRSMSYRLAAIALGSLLVGPLAEMHIRLPAALSLIGTTLCCIATYFFVEPPDIGVATKFKWREHYDLMKLSVLFVVNHQRIKWIIGFIALISVSSKIWFFTYNPYFELVGLPLRTFGWIFFALNVVAAASSYCADWLDKKCGEAGSIIIIILAIVAPITLMGLFPCPAAALLVLVQNLVRGYLSPFIEHFLHGHLDSKNRATVMSIKSSAVNMLQFFGLAGFGFLLKLYSLPTCLVILGVSTLVVGGFVLGTYFRVFKR